MKDCKTCINYQNNSCITGIWSCEKGKDQNCLEFMTEKMQSDLTSNKRSERVIELMQDLLYDAKMNELSVYENGDALINDIPNNAKKYVIDNIIKIPSNTILLVDDYGEMDPILGAQAVYDFYEDALIFDCAWHPEDVKTVKEYLKAQYNVRVK